MSGGGGSTTVDGGLTDDQFQDLVDNQVGISDQIVDARTDATDRYDTFDTRFNTVDTGVTGLGTNISSGFTNIQDLLKQYDTGMNNQFDTVNTGIGNNANALSSNATGIGNIQSDVTGGFKNVGQRFDTVDADTKGIQTAVDTGNADQAQGFRDAQSDRTSQFDAARNNMNNALDTGFANTNTAMTKGFNDANTQLTATQANILNGQGGLQTNLDTMSDTADAYATQSMKNQEALQEGQDEFVSNFDSYSDRYGQDQEVAQQSRADLARAQSNQTNRLRNDIGNFAQASATGQQNLSGEMERGFMTAESAMSQGTADIMNNLNSGQITSARDMARIASTQEGLDNNMRQEFSQLGQAFNDNGALIANSIDSQGNTLTRKMDDQGNLILDRFSATGQNLGNQVINVQNSLRTLNDLQNQVQARPYTSTGGLMFNSGTR